MSLVEFKREIMAVYSEKHMKCYKLYGITQNFGGKGDGTYSIQGVLNDYCTILD